MEVRRPSEKSDVVQVASAYRRGSEKYDYLASRGSVSQGVINFERWIDYNYRFIYIRVTNVFNCLRNFAVFKSTSLMELFDENLLAPPLQEEVVPQLTLKSLFREKG